MNCFLGDFWLAAWLPTFAWTCFFLSKAGFTPMTWPISNTADSPIQVWALLLQLTSYPWDFCDYRKCRSPCWVPELNLPMTSFPARAGIFNCTRCLLYTYLHSTSRLFSLAIFRNKSCLQATTELDRLGSSLRSQSENVGSTQTTFWNELYEKPRMNVLIFAARR